MLTVELMKEREETSTTAAGLEFSIEFRRHLARPFRNDHCSTSAEAEATADGNAFCFRWLRLTVRGADVARTHSFDPKQTCCVAHMARWLPHGTALGLSLGNAGKYSSRNTACVFTGRYGRGIGQSCAVSQGAQQHRNRGRRLKLKLVRRNRAGHLPCPFNRLDANFLASVKLADTPH